MSDFESLPSSFCNFVNVTLNLLQKRKTAITDMCYQDQKKSVALLLLPFSDERFPH